MPERRTHFRKPVKTTLHNTYTHGSGVGAVSAHTKLALSRRASTRRPIIPPFIICDCSMVPVITSPDATPQQTQTACLKLHNNSSCCKVCYPV